MGKCSAKVTFEIIIFNTDMFEEIIIKNWLFKHRAMSYCLYK